jgi:Arc/MetJ-type ribon-helix-helix transcriptional regulator
MAVTSVRVIAGDAGTAGAPATRGFSTTLEPGIGQNYPAARVFPRLPADGAAPSYDPGMSDRKTRLTVTIDPHLAAYAEHLVEVGKASSVSAVVNDALEAERQRDQKASRLWREAAERADPAQVARMIAHVNAQVAELPPSHRYR